MDPGAVPGESTKIHKIFVDFGGLETGSTCVVKGKFVSVMVRRYRAVLYLQTTTSS